MNRSLVVAGAVALALGASAAQAQTVINSTFTASATVPAACSISTAPSNMAFGTYTGAVLDASSSLAVTCANGLAYKVFLTTSSGARGLIASVGGLPTLNYELFTDSARTTVFPSTSAGATAATGTGASQTLSIFGRIAAGQTNVPGSYSQTVTVNVEY